MSFTPEDASARAVQLDPTPAAIAARLAERLAATAATRDVAGGTPKAERDLLRVSGLLRLSIPTEHCGLGASWAETLGIVRQLARVDSSVAHVFAFHHLQLASIRLFGAPAQYEPWLADTARRDWFWGNALNPLDKRTVATRVAGGRVFSGRKSFCSGALDSDMLLASAVEDDAGGKLIIAAIPTRRAGITLFEDWDNMGQRQTDSGSASFEHVAVAENEILSDPGPLSSPRACLRPLLAQLIFVNVFLGIAEGAFAEARDYTRSQTRAWSASPAAVATEDPYILGHYGDFWVSLEATRKLADHAVACFDAAWNEGLQLTEAGRGDVALAVATAKVSATRGGLDLTSRIFEVTGARATTAALRLDRFWRNLRVHTLHDPVDYKVRELGDWALNGKYPTPSFYS